MIYVGCYYIVGLLMAIAIEGRRMSSASFVLAAIWPLPVICALYHKLKRK